MMNKPIRIAALATALLAATGLAQAQEIKLEFLAWYGAEQAKTFQEAIGEFEKSHPNIKIKLNTVAGTGAATFPNVLRTRIAGGKAPDLFTMWGGTLAAPFIDSKAALDLSPYYKKYNWDQTLLPAAVNAIKRNGITWGAPIDLRAISFYYRKDIFKKHGLTVPASFTELEGACDKLKAQQVTCLSAGGTYGWHAMRVFDFFLEHTAGPEVHDQLLAGKANWDRPEVVAAFALLKKWTANGWLPSGYMGISPDQAQQLFLQGKAAMVPEGDWFVTNANAAGLNAETYGFFPPPTDQKPVRLDGFAEQYMISRQSKNPDAAAEFINWWLQPATQTKYFAVNGSTATKGAAPPSEDAQGAEYVKMIAQYPTFTIMDQAFPPEVMSTTYFRLQSAVGAGQISPEAAAKEMQQGVSRH
jgi:raffinose/stachyose/melibiose transport system substrate-binding protein